MLEQDGATSRPVEVVAGPESGVRGDGDEHMRLGGACRFRSVRKGMGGGPAGVGGVG